ncbi:MAG: OmpH family outer membrane protein [Calditrichae bacterium]|nr:OmpH family outer membrane protein [Calditrichia bacterium]
MSPTHFQFNPFKISLPVMLCWLILLWLPLTAQTPKTGFTNAEGLLAAMPAYQQAQQTLQTLHQQMKKKLDDQEEAFNQKAATYQQQQTMMTAERKTALEAELRKMQEDYQKNAMQYEQDLAKKESELLKPVIDKINAAIKQVAEQKGLQAVWKAEALLYADETNVIDISEDVAKILGIPLNNQ